VNQDCYGAGWLFAIAPSSSEEFSSLLSAGDYSKQLQTQTSH
jgi:glycine cleavage system H lipoate-binding protein